MPHYSCDIDVVSHPRTTYRIARNNSQVTKPAIKPQNSKVLNGPRPAVAVTPMTPTMSAPPGTKMAASRGFVIAFRRAYLHTSHFPPSLAQCRQYLQFLQALQGLEPVHVAEENTSSGIRLRSTTDKNIREMDDTIFFDVSSPSFLCRRNYWMH